MVVGETSRALNWQLYGYERETNPLLVQQSGLVAFPKVLTESNTTHKSVPMLLSDVTACSYDSIYHRKGIITAFKEAGFRTAFFSNQRFNHSFIDFFGREADAFDFIKEDSLDFSYNPSDNELLKLVEQELAKGAKKQFIVLHTYGSHFNYRERYPSGDAFFTPDYPVEAERKFRDNLVNAYDNSVRYTDSLLARLIGMLENQGTDAALIYTSDHGEDIFDDPRHLFLHASPVPSYYQLHIPFLTMTVATVNDTAYTVGGLASAMSGPAMAVAIGYALHCPPLVLFSLITVGFASNALGGAGGPLAVLFVAVLASEAGKAVSKETKVDILVTPLVTIGVGIALSALLAPALGKAAMKVGNVIMWATELQPFLMGILVSVFVGIALTLPISSAAICAALGLTGLAGGAAVAGCCAQMVGFAVMSFPENKWGGLVSQGIGTSMLQMGNIVKNPKIWIAPILTSAITGPIATCLFHMEMNGAAVSSGMGTCGLVGQIGVYTGWVKDVSEGTKAAITTGDWAGLLLVSIILPAVICPIINMFLKKIGWVKEGDLKLS